MDGPAIGERGTLIAFAASDLVFGPHGERGPIGVQMSEPGELHGIQAAA